MFLFVYLVQKEMKINKEKDLIFLDLLDQLSFLAPKTIPTEKIGPCVSYYIG